MTPELLQLTERLLKGGEVGTLCLGKGSRQRRVFLSGTEAHLLDAGRQGRILPSAQLLQCERLSRSMLDELASTLRRDQGSLAPLLAQRGLLDAEVQAAYAHDELLEELLQTFERHGQDFRFERGSVPEELLLGEDATPPGIDCDRLLRALNLRHHELRTIERVLPSPEEVPVLAELGIRARNQAGDWAFQQIAELVDGFRTVREIIHDCILFPHSTRLTLMSALQRSLVKKTVFPEFQELDPERLTPRDAARWADLLRDALPLAVDEMPLRRLLATVGLRAGDSELAIEQFIVLGDMLERRGELARALEHYQEALRWAPGSLILQEKVVKVHLRFAEESFRNDQHEEGRRFLEEALRHNSEDLELYVRILDSYPDPEQAIQHALPRLLKIMIKAGHAELAIALFEELVRRAPHHDNLRRRFVNFLLDHGATLRALEELEQLAVHLLERGAVADAQAIHEKIALLAPDRRPPQLPAAARRAQRDRRRAEGPHRRRVGFVGVTVCTLLALFGGYQISALFALLDLHQQVDALVGHQVPEPGSSEHHSYAHRTDAMLREFRSFRRRHFASLWSGAAARLEEIVSGRQRFLDSQLNRVLGELLASAEQAELRGRLDEARRIYGDVQRRAGETFWSARASQHLEELEGYLEEAAALAVRRSQAMARRDYEQAFEISQRLVYDYPRSAQAKEVLLPLLVVSEPPGARVRAGEVELGVTPLVVENPREHRISVSLAPIEQALED